MTHDGAWIVLDETDTSRTLMLDNGDGTTTLKVQHFGMQEVLDHNAEFRAAQAGQSWGDGKIIGRVPLSYYYASGLARAAKEGDAAFQKRFWNDRDNYRLRTKEGAI